MCYKNPMTSKVRERMIEVTAALVRRRGYHGASLNEILAESGAPRGSLYHYFRGGKEELVLEATRQGVSSITQSLKEAFTQATDPSEAVYTFVRAVAQEFLDSGFVFGCPVAPLILDDVLAETCREAFEEWEQVLVEGLGSAGIDRERARSLATLIVCGIEGGLMSARVSQNIAPLHVVAEEFALVVRSALPRSKAASAASEAEAAK